MNFLPIPMTSLSTENTLDNKPKYTNRLVTEKSLYLLQHAHNPVQWYPWCQEAIDTAQKENKLIFLSVGYSTCHWCHAMEIECFKNEEAAKIMNEHFVNIKVDREERPDIDRLYMTFLMSSSGRGGWPMSLFLTPNLKPITGGAYFPLEDQWGRPGFKSVLLTLATRWKENNEQFLQSSATILDLLQNMPQTDSNPSADLPGAAAWDKCVQAYIYCYESKFGGFCLAPKFPQPSILNFLFHYYARHKSNHQCMKCLEMCLHTLKMIAYGGIHDHIFSGFHRYTLDIEWHVPHFEKMLYDQAMLAIAYTNAYLATKDKFYADVVRDIVKFVNSDLRHDSGGYYSAEDADSFPTIGALHKKEGSFYVWEYEELKPLLEDKDINSISYLDIFCYHFRVENGGNVPHECDPNRELLNKNILIMVGSKKDSAKQFGLSVEDFEKVIFECVDIVYKARQKRPRPQLDSKMLCSWNGLMLSGLAQAGQGLREKDIVEDAKKTAQFIKKYLYDDSSKILLHSCYRGDDGAVCQRDQPIKGFLDDYTNLIKGLLDLYEASLDLSWLKWARELQQKQNELFWDSTNGGYFTSSSEDPTVVLRLKEDHDGAEPSGNSIACHNLLRLAAYADKNAAPEGGDNEREIAKKVLIAFSKKLKESPNALPEMMSALMFYNDSSNPVLRTGGLSDPSPSELVYVVRSRAHCRTECLLQRTPPLSDILSSRNRASDVPPACVCLTLARRLSQN